MGNGPTKFPYYHENEALAWAAMGFIGRSLRREGRIPELLALDSDLAMPAGPYIHELTQATHMLAALALGVRSCTARPRRGGRRDLAPLGLLG